MMDFRHNPELGRYEAWLDAELVAEAGYTTSGTVSDFNHTKVRPEYEGQGIASQLVRYAMDEIRAAGQWQVKATCPYVARWFETHSDYAELLVEPQV